MIAVVGVVVAVVVVVAVAVVAAVAAAECGGKTIFQSSYIVLLIVAVVALSTGRQQFV